MSIDKVNVYARRGLVVMAIAFLSACATLEFGQDFDPKGFHSWVKRGTTTQAEVKNKVGEPTNKGLVVESDGNELERWVYYYGKGKMNDMQNAQFKMLEVRFDSSKKVVSYNWSAE
ncbi:MAG: hypothetical protein OEX00_06950 [Gammaproteobacteria bacterium]|nr:hypothetical protein [Gammaproteobacteria bacterium]MDH5693823.1 hypothetical protein [Gammaproteobacteria bacterium]